MCIVNSLLTIFFALKGPLSTGYAPFVKLAPLSFVLWWSLPNCILWKSPEVLKEIS